ncbi:hypothetical protein KPB06_33435 [Burkholderia semiarida]|nr:hypothetical protein [Burkholderia semiarida]
MCLKITDDIVALTRAIDNFNPTYHQDYFTVRSQAVDYLLNAPSTGSAKRLSHVLVQALRSWGAGKRGAPACQSIEAVIDGLCNPMLHDNLTKLAASFPSLALIDGVRSVNASCSFKTVDDFDECLIGTLIELASVILVANTNVTYPMKALLLIAGLMPAFDSQVRRGLGMAGLSGFGRGGRPRTRYLMPVKGHADAKRICVLPFYIAECVAREFRMLDEATENSRFPMLTGQYGRVFDILLFMQQNLTQETALVSFSPSRPWAHWYAI